MNEIEIRDYFNSILHQSPPSSPSVASIETLYECLKRSSATTLIGLSNELKGVVEIMLNMNYSYITISSACELFLRFISLASLDQPNQNFSDCIYLLLQRGQIFRNRIAESSLKIARLGLPFIRNGSKILTHACSSLVVTTLAMACAKSKAFQVYATQSSPNNSGLMLKKKLDKYNIPCVVIPDCAAGSIMETIDFVLVGAEGVAESGGIFNKIGTFGIAVCAKAMNKPLYVMAESIKFVRSYPMNQSDVPQRFKYPLDVLQKTSDLREVCPSIDYTPPNYITLLFTDLGILTPAAVSDELIKLYL